MSLFTFKLDDSGAAVVRGSSNVGEVYLMHSGALLESLSVEPGGERRTLICVVARTGSVLVTATYDDDSVFEDQSWEVFPGGPLKVLASGVPAEVTIEQSGGELPKVEVLVAESAVTVAELEFLVLNAGSGVRRGVGAMRDLVLGWRDTRPVSGAPEEFTPWAFLANGGAEIIESDPDFAGKPSVIWSETQAGGYRYSAEVAGLWDFLGSAGEFLFMMTFKPHADRGVDFGGIWRKSTTGPGLELGIDGGYRSTVKLSDVDTEEVADLTETGELIEDGTSMVYVLLKNADGIQVYRQGAWELLGEDSSGDSGSPSLVRPVLGIPSSGGIESDLKIADLRIWKTMPSDVAATIDSYIDMAVSEYGVDDSYRQGTPFVTGAHSMFRANRGVIKVLDAPIYRPPPLGPFTGTAVNSWLDTRPETAISFVGEISAPSTLPSFEVAESVDGHQVIRSYGGGAAGGSPGQRLTADSTDTPLSDPTFSVAFIIEPQANVSASWRGGAILATGGTGADAVFLVSINANGVLRLFISTPDEDDIDLSLDIGSQAFGHALAVMVRIQPGTAQLSVRDLVTGDEGQTSVETASDWGGIALTDAATLFDYLSYYSANQRYEGFIAELYLLSEFVSDDDVELWLTYANRRYGF